MVGAVRWGLLVVAVAVACVCGPFAPAASASLSVPTGGPAVPYTAPSANYASVPDAIAAFEAAAGGADNGTVAGEHSGGFRHATWDQIALDGSDPGSTTIESGHVIVPARSRMQPWGLELGPEIAVANDGFQSVSSADFTPFTAPNVWGPFNSPTPTAEFDVVAPTGQGSTPTPAQTRGLGIVFLNPNHSPLAQIQYYNGAIPLLIQPLMEPVGTTSFAGLLFPSSVVTRVVVTFASPIFQWDGTMVTNGGSSTVAGDDVVLAEPAPARPAVAATAGVPVAPVLDTFTNTESTATATIDWGDGSRTVGTIVPVGNDTFNVTGSHSYALSGSYTATVSVTGFSGDEQSSQTVIQVGPRTSSTNLTCSPSPVAVTASTTCTATVSDVGGGGPVVPTGLVGFSSPTPGAAFTDDSGCVLGATATPGVSMCQVRFAPSQLPPNQAKVLVAYDGDGAHAASAGTATVAVRAQHCTVKTLGAKLNRRPPGLGVLVTCDARANVQITVNAVAPRKGAFKAIKLQFGTLKTSVGAGRPTVLLIKPASGVLPILRAANKRRQRVSLKLTLVASSHATRTTTTTRVSAVRLR